MDLIIIISLYDPCMKHEILHRIEYNFPGMENIFEEWLHHIKLNISSTTNDATSQGSVTYSDYNCPFCNKSRETLMCIKSRKYASDLEFHFFKKALRIIRAEDHTHQREAGKNTCHALASQKRSHVHS